MRKAVFDKLNKRRHELISKKHAGGLTEREKRVFDRLQNSPLLDYYVDSIGGGLPFRELMLRQAEMKQALRRVYPKGVKART